MVFYDPADPTRAGEFWRVMQEQIDLPARKIMIKAMSWKSLQCIGRTRRPMELQQGRGEPSQPGTSTAPWLLVGNIVNPAAAPLNWTPLPPMFFANSMFAYKPSSRKVRLKYFPSWRSDMDDRMAYISVSERFRSPYSSSGTSWPL